MVIDSLIKMEEYQICKELKNLTPDIIKEWSRKEDATIYLVKKLTYFRCPVSKELVLEKECRNCPHNYGDASAREIYCLPDSNKSVGVRSLRKHENE